MLVKTIIDEDFTNYKKASMFVGTCFCNWKCCLEQSLPVEICQNNSLALEPNIEYPVEKIFNRYINNIFTSAIVLGGLEVMMQFDEVVELISYFRTHNCEDPFILFTGYYENEIKKELQVLKKFKNIIVKFGRYIPNQESRYDEIIGINLVSKNQYAKKIS